MYFHQIVRYYLSIVLHKVIALLGNNYPRINLLFINSIKITPRKFNSIYHHTSEPEAQGFKCGRIG